MTDLEIRLEQGLRADMPPARDPMFRTQVFLRKERAVFRRRVLIIGLVALAASMVAWLGVQAVGMLLAGRATSDAGAVVVGLLPLTVLVVSLARFLQVHVHDWRIRTGLMVRAVHGCALWP